MRTNEKLKVFAQNKFGNSQKLAEAMNISPSLLSQYASGKKGLGNVQLNRLHELGCDINWLMSEDDEPMPENVIQHNQERSSDSVNRMLREAYGYRLEFYLKSRFKSIEDAAQGLGIAPELLKQYYSGRRNATELSPKLIELGFDMVWIMEGVRTQIIGGTGTFRGNWYPVVNTVTAGTPEFIYRETNIIGYMIADYRKELNCYVLTIEGDSMAGGSIPIYDGDMVLVDMDIQPVRGELVVCIANGRQMIKQYYLDNEETITFRSYNADKVQYPDLLYDKSEVELMHRVVRIIRKNIVV